VIWSDIDTPGRVDVYRTACLTLSSYMRLLKEIDGVLAIPDWFEGVIQEFTPWDQKDRGGILRNLSWTLKRILTENWSCVNVICSLDGDKRDVALTPELTPLCFSSEQGGAYRAFVGHLAFEDELACVLSFRELVDGSQRVGICSVADGRTATVCLVGCIEELEDLCMEMRWLDAYKESNLLTATRVIARKYSLVDATGQERHLSFGRGFMQSLRDNADRRVDIVKIARALAKLKYGIRDSGLRSEKLRGQKEGCSGQWRMRVDGSIRIHYSAVEDGYELVCYYGPSQHDDGLKAGQG